MASRINLTLHHEKCSRSSASWVEFHTWKHIILGKQGSTLTSLYIEPFNHVHIAQRFFWRSFELGYSLDFGLRVPVAEDKSPCPASWWDCGTDQWRPPEWHLPVSTFLGDQSQRFASGTWFQSSHKAGTCCSRSPSYWRASCRTSRRCGFRNCTGGRSCSISNLHRRNAFGCKNTCLLDALVPFASEVPSNSLPDPFPVSKGIRDWLRLLAEAHLTSSK